MRNRLLLILSWSTLLSGLSSLTAQADEVFQLQDGDQVVFLGNSFFERAIHHGHIEHELTCRWPKRNITFRNLGWDGDTVFGHSRAGGRRRAVFGEPEEGFKKMVEHVRLLKPDVVFLAYGYNESFELGGDTEQFRGAVDRFIKEVSAVDKSPRFVLLSPTPMEHGFGAPAAYVDARNRLLERYAETLAEVAAKGGHAFVDLLSPLSKGNELYSDNGIHPSSDGYQRIAEIIVETLRCPPPAFASPPEAVRSAIIRKNTLYFHRWRPRNDAFVYGERKREQKIAQTEPEKFEPFVAKAEAKIRELLDQEVR